MDDVLLESCCEKSGGLWENFCLTLVLSHGKVRSNSKSFKINEALESMIWDTFVNLKLGLKFSINYECLYPLVSLENFLAAIMVYSKSAL